MKVDQKDLHVGWHGECTWGACVNWFECVVLNDKKVIVAFWRGGAGWELQEIKGRNEQFRTLTPSQILEDDNGWFERGEYPSTGMVVEYKKPENIRQTVVTKEWEDGDQLEVLAIREGEAESVAVVWNKRDCTASGVILDVLRPIKSDRDKVVEAARKALSELEKFSISSIAESLFDAGLLKLPEGESDEIYQTNS